MAALALAPASADVVLVVQEERVRICASRCFRRPDAQARRRPGGQGQAQCACRAGAALPQQHPRRGGGLLCQRARLRAPSASSQPARDTVRAGGSGVCRLAMPSTRRGLAPRPCRRDGIRVLRPWALLATASAPVAGRACSRRHLCAPPQRRRPGCLATTCAPRSSCAEAASLVPALEAAPFLPTGATFCLLQRRSVKEDDGVTDLTDRVLHSSNVRAFNGILRSRRL